MFPNQDTASALTGPAARGYVILYGTRTVSSRIPQTYGPKLQSVPVLCAVAECGHFGRAAAKLNISQPPLSRQIAALEEELGTKLLERSRKGAELTPTGRQFYADAQAVLHLVQQTQRNVAAAGWGEVGNLSLGFTMCAAHGVVPALTRLYVSAFPRYGCVFVN